MIVELYSMLDVKAQVFHNPFQAQNEETALRLLGDLMMDDQTIMAKHPEDFQMFLVGRFNNSTGEITPDMKFVVHCHQMKNGRNE